MVIYDDTSCCLRCVGVPMGGEPCYRLFHMPIIDCWLLIFLPRLTLQHPSSSSSYYDSNRPPWSCDTTTLFSCQGVPAYVSRGSVIRLLEAMMDRYTKNVKPFMFTNSADRRPKLWRRWISSLRFCLTNSSFCPFFGYKWMMNDRANFTDDVASNRSLNAVLIWSPRRLLTAEKNLDEKCYS